MPSWPPTKGELEELYLNESLSADAIAARYGRSGKYPGAIVYHYLRKYGIPIRDKCAWQRHLTEEEIATCVKEYNEGKSLWDLADEFPFSAETIRKGLISHGVETRDKVEAQIQKVQKYEKKPFSGDPHEKAYLYGLKQGDLWVTRHGRAIRVKTSSTHPAMIELVASCFLPYGAVHIIPRRCKNGEFEWSIECDLNRSFSFLEEDTGRIPAWVDDDAFAHYLAGFFDAEGCVMVAPSSGSKVRISISNTNLPLLKEIRSRVRPDYGEWRLRLVTPAGHVGLVTAKLDCWQLERDARGPCLAFLKQIPFRHPEKKEKARLLVNHFENFEYGDLVAEYRKLVGGIHYDRDTFKTLAKETLEYG